MYIEYCKGIKDRGNIVDFGSIQPHQRDFEAYISLFPFTVDIRDHIKQKGSIKGFKGKHYLPYICIDIDVKDENGNADIETARQSALEVLSILSKKGVDSDEVYIFFSGGKGFHINITQKVYGKMEPSETIAETVKEWVLGNFGHVKGVDSLIYEPHRLIRVSNSKHKSGLYKVPLTFDELKDGNVIELANQSRVIEHKKAADIRYNKKIREELLTPIQKTPTNENHKLNKGFFSPVPDEGNRNQRYFEQAITLFKTSQLTSISINEILLSINSASSNPLTESEIKSIVISASSYREETESEISFQTFGELVPEWMEYNKKETSPLKFGLDQIDLEFNGKLRGQVGLIVGYGGSKKSLIAQNLCFQNIPNGHRAVYSNMEMGATQLMNRFIDMVVDDTVFNASYELRKKLEMDYEGVQKILAEQLAPAFSDKLLMTQNGSMTAAGYDKLLTKITNDVGSVDMLIVDGLSMMGGTGSETEVYTRNSKELKDLAKKHNVFIVLIAHASRGEDLDSRNLIRNIRGSEKVADNVDFIITMSQIKIDSDEWHNRYGVYNLWNKRGTGNRVQKVFEFDTKRLLMFDYIGNDAEIFGREEVNTGL